MVLCPRDNLNQSKSSSFPDINECALKLDDCAENEVCVNGDGFYYCEDPNNPDGDLDTTLQKCPEGYTFNGENMVCDGWFDLLLDFAIT